MKRFILPAAFALSLLASSAPVIVLAQEGPAACSTNADCPSGSRCGAGGLCVQTSFTPKPTTVNGVVQQGASSGVNVTYLKSYTDTIQQVINVYLVPVLIAIAFLVFIWGVYKYFILGADDEKARETGRSFIMWGILGFVVIFSVWGIVALVGSTLGLSAGVSAPKVPKI